MILNKGFIERRPDWTDVLYQLTVLLILLCFSHSYCACSRVHTFLKSYGELVFRVLLKMPLFVYFGFTDMHSSQKYAVK